MFRFGKGTALKLIWEGECFRKQAHVVDSLDSVRYDTIGVGSKSVMCCYTTNQNDNLDTLQYYKLQELVTTSKKVIHPKMLPPT